MKLEENKVLKYSAIAFQYVVLAILTFALVTEIGDTNTIIGVLAGLLVGIKIEDIK